MLLIGGVVDSFVAGDVIVFFFAADAETLARPSSPASLRFPGAEAPGFRRLSLGGSAAGAGPFLFVCFFPLSSGTGWRPRREKKNELHATSAFFFFLRGPVFFFFSLALFFFFFCPSFLLECSRRFPGRLFSLSLFNQSHHHQIAVEIARRSAVSIAAAHAAVSGKREKKSFSSSS